MRPLRYSLALVSLLGALVAINACTLQRCSEGAVCGARTSVGGGPSAVPSPTAPAPAASPSASPTPKPAENCRIDFMVLQPRDGITLAQGAEARLSLTPYQSVTNPDGSVARVEVSEACNLPRIPYVRWVSSSAAVVVGVGFEPTVRRIGVGEATVYADIEGHVSNSVTVR